MDYGQSGTVQGILGAQTPQITGAKMPNRQEMMQRQSAVANALRNPAQSAAPDPMQPPEQPPAY